MSIRGVNRRPWMPVVRYNTPTNQVGPPAIAPSATNCFANRL